MKFIVPTREQVEEAQNLSGYNDLSDSQKEFMQCISMHALEHGTEAHGLDVSETVAALQVMGRFVKVAYKNFVKTTGEK